MSKIYDSNNVLVKEDDQYSIGTVLDFLEENNILHMKWDCLSKLIKTMAGDSCTAFNTVGEMIKEIPEVVDCGEECAFLCVIDDDRQGNESKWFVLGWDYEDDEILCNRILQEYFTEYRVVEK
jgi:hypothetical protein